MSPAHPRAAPPEPPAVFEVARELPPGRYPLLKVFRGLNRVKAFDEYPCSSRDRRDLARRTTVEIARRKGEWMYVAPHRIPAHADRRWRPVTSRNDCVVVSREHLRHSPALVLYLDILHELFHVVQRNDGRNLWDDSYEYVDRPTELEAYRFAIREARRLKASESFLREYLRVMWVTPKDHRRLLAHVGVGAR